MKKHFVIAAAVAGALLYAFVFRGGEKHDFSDAGLSKDVLIQSRKMGLPKTVGPMALESITAAPGRRLVVRVSLSNASASAINVERIQNSKAQLAKALCAGDWMREALKHGVTATYDIYGNDQVLATSMTFANDDCG